MVSLVDSLCATERERESRFRDRTPALPPIDQEALCRVCRPGAELEMLRQAFLARQHLFTAELPPSQAEAELRKLCAEVFPLRRHRTITLQWQQPEVGQDLQLTWQLRSRLKQLAGRWPHLSSVFRVWQHHARLVRRVKELKRNSRRRRREHWQQQLAEAEQAGQTRNPLKFFQVVQRLAPKRDQTRVQIRDKAGHILTPDQEDRALAEYWTGIYSSSRMARQPAILCNPVLLSPQELQDALRALKQRKAVARGMAPAAVWKALASPLSHYLSEVLGAMWQPGRLRIPAVWTQSDLHFLPKPQKTTKRPQDLRPIALQSAAAKAVTTVFKHRLSPSFLEAMRGLPQYAYTANRSTQEGIARVAAHCSMVRDLVKTQTLTVFDRYAGAKYSPCLGGAQLSIDLSKAFDLLPRKTLHALLADTDLSPDERQILLEWHQAGRYRIQGRGSEKSVYVQLDCGVRQGCVLSPSLWGLFTKCIQQRLDAANGAGWTAQRGTMFADDLHFQWVFHTEGELSRVRAEVLAIFRTLRDLGMKANPEKSKFLISARGQQARKWIKRWIRKDPEGQRQFHFGGGRTDRVPVATQFAYLGTILSYRNFELETARHRLGVATGHRDRLRKVLHARRVLSVGHRVRLWRIMVQTSQLYALEAVGITPEVAKLLHVQTMRHLRAIIGSARHIDGDSDQLFMLKHGLPDCVELVKARCDIFCRRLEQEGLAVPCFGAPEIRQWARHVRSSLPPPYIAKQRPGTQSTSQPAPAVPAASASVSPEPLIPSGVVPTTLPVLESAPPLPTEAPAAALAVPPPPQMEGFRCSACSQVFPSLHDLKTHEGKAHKLVRARDSQVQHTDHGFNGFPVCRHCGEKFTKWNSLTRHIARHGCPALERGTPEAYAKTQADTAVLPPVQRPLVITAVRESSWEALLEHTDLCAELKQRRALCYQWMASGNSLRKHLRTKHPEALLPHESAIGTQAALWKPYITSPCQACGATIADRRQHAGSCLVLLQLMLMSGHCKSRQLPAGPGAAGEATMGASSSLAGRGGSGTGARGSGLEHGGRGAGQGKPGTGRQAQGSRQAPANQRQTSLRFGPRSGAWEGQRKGQRQRQEGCQQDGVERGGAADGGRDAPTCRSGKPSATGHQLPSHDEERTGTGESAADHVQCLEGLENHGGQGAGEVGQAAALQHVHPRIRTRDGFGRTTTVGSGRSDMEFLRF